MDMKDKSPVKAIISRLIVGKVPNNGTKPEESTEDSGKEKEIVAQELLDAIKDNDAKAVVSAISSLIEMCKYDMKEDVEEDETEE